MFERLREWIRAWLGIRAEAPELPLEQFVRAYEDITGDNITATVANKLAMLTIADSTLELTDPAGREAMTPRAQLIAEAMTGLWREDITWIVAQAYGKGGVVLAPRVTTGRRLHVDVADQSRMTVLERDGDRPTNVALVADQAVVNDKRYSLIANYAMVEAPHPTSLRSATFLHAPAPTRSGSPAAPGWNPQDSPGLVAPVGSGSGATAAQGKAFGDGDQGKAFGDGRGQIIRYRAVDEVGAPVGLATVPQWASITPEVRIMGTDRLLLAFLRCPRDNRRTGDKSQGVPITYGAEKLVTELTEHANIYRREYKLTRPMLGLDSTLWASSGEVMNISRLRRSVQDSDDPFIPMDAPSLSEKAVWQYYAPSIRQEAMEARYQSLCRRLEKACGLSQGILTERQTLNYANRDEVRAAQYDTFSVIHAMRMRLEAALNDLAYGLDALSEFAGLTPAGGRGQYRLGFDWDMSLIESTGETFQQYLELANAGAVSRAELRQWVKGGTLEEAEAAVSQIEAREKAGKLEGER